MVIVGTVDTWGSRYNINPDGISYIEMAQHAMAGVPDGFINGYWSPGYPMLLAPVLRTVGHDWVTAVPALHLVNLILFCLAGWLCVRMFRAVSEPSLVRLAAPVGAAAYLLVTVKCVGLGLLTPDVGVTLMVLAAAACALQLEQSSPSWWWAVALGASLATGYWLKGIMMPLGAVLLALLALHPPRTERGRLKIGVAATVFVLGCLPLVAMVSARTGHVTMGEVGRLNYAWEVDGVAPFTGWVGDSVPGHGVPSHPPRVLQGEPQTLEFARPLRATYPLWFDPSYWYAGVRMRVDLQGQWRVLRQGLNDLWLVMQQLGVVVLGVLALWLATARTAGEAAPPRVPRVLGAWSFAALLVYALVHVEARYLAGFVIVAVLVAWRALAGRRLRREILWVTAIAVIAMLVSLVENVRDNTGGFQPGYRPDYLIDGDKLRAAGIARGDPVAMVGDAFEAYAAFAIGSPIIAQVTDSAGFWQLTQAGRADLQARLSGAGVKAILANNVDGSMTAEGWRILARPDSSNLGVLLLRRLE